MGNLLLKSKVIESFVEDYGLLVLVFVAWLDVVGWGNVGVIGVFDNSRIFIL